MFDQDAPGRAANRAVATFDGTGPTPAEADLSRSVGPADSRALPATGGEAALVLALAGGALVLTGLLLVRVVTRRRVPHDLQPE